MKHAPALTLDDEAIVRPRTDEQRISAWLFVCCAMVFLMVIIGGITRLTESGLSITEWQPVSGILPPLNHAEWQEAFRSYKAIPQYRAIHEGMTLAQFKGIYFWEYVHRLLGRLIGVVFVLPFLWFLMRGAIRGPLVPKLLMIFALGALQGVVGWYMVSSGLEGRIEVSQYRLAIHLAMAVLIYAAMLWVALDLRSPYPSAAPRPGLRAWAWVVLALVAVTMVAGSFVAGTRAGYLDNTFPLMEGQWVPPGYWHLTPRYLNFFDNLVAVQFDHRVLAAATLGSVLLLWLSSVATPPAPRPVHWLAVLALVQVGLGIATLLLVVPVPVAVLHQAGGLAVFTAALAACHALRV
ncbi:MAG TPA: COX15/CtaA family protein [Stellaceae bacterium]|nr:COX15/CtaA family protein [Stellaceae bacterium]